MEKKLGLQPYFFEAEEHGGLLD